MNVIAAVDEFWGIGREGKLLARIPADMAYFKAKTLGKTVLMGKTTFFSLPLSLPLKQRQNIVLSTDTSLSIEGARVCHHLKDALCITGDNHDDLFVIGGQSVYEQCLPYCRLAYITKYRPPQGIADRFFPNLDRLHHWQVISRDNPNLYGDIQFEFLVYENTSVLPFSHTAL